MATVGTIREWIDGLQDDNDVVVGDDGLSIIAIDDNGIIDTLDLGEYAEV